MNTAIKPYQALEEICQSPEIANAVREVNEMLGFICAVAASPQPLDLQEWFPSLWTQGSAPSLSSENLAVEFAAAVLQFYENCLLSSQHGQPLLLPTELWLDDARQVTEQGRAFACGYLTGFHHIEEIWQAQNVAPASEPEQLLQTTLLLLSKMAATSNTDPQMQALFVQLPSMQEIVSSLPPLLSALGNFSVQVAAND